MTNETLRAYGKRVLPLAGLLLAVTMAPSVLGRTADTSDEGTASGVSRAGELTQESGVYLLKEAGIQFEIPKGWKTEVDKTNGNVVLSIEEGAVTVTFVVEDNYAAVVSGMKDGLKGRLTDMKSDGEAKQDTHNGMVHLSETGAGMLKEHAVFWSVDVLKAGKNVTILTFGIQKVMEAHGDEYGKWVMSIKKI